MTEGASAIIQYSTARGYLQAAKMIWESPHRQGPNVLAVFLPMHLLLGFAAELYFKAWLLHAGVDASVLRSVSLRHDLRALLESARAHGFSANDWIDELVNKLHDHHKKFEYRYSSSETNYDGSVLPTGFAVFDQLDFIVDQRIGASASQGLEPGH